MYLEVISDHHVQQNAQMAKVLLQLTARVGVLWKMENGLDVLIAVMKQQFCPNPKPGEGIPETPSDSLG
ncbi:hypothetical protein NV63_01355 [Elizabethkingia anophelis]|nr:hypothetical protein NV63_01355 [Elizabethkingia anophelis]